MPAPVGNQNARKGKLWHDAIIRAIKKRSASDRMDALDALAERLIDACATGDLPALKELGDRLDGKPAQAIIGDPDSPLHVIGEIRRTIVGGENA